VGHCGPPFDPGTGPSSEKTGPTENFGSRLFPRLALGHDMRLIRCRETHSAPGDFAANFSEARVVAAFNCTFPLSHHGACMWATIRVRAGAFAINEAHRASRISGTETSPLEHSGRWLSKKLIRSSTSSPGPVLPRLLSPRRRQHCEHSSSKNWKRSR